MITYQYDFSYGDTHIIGGKTPCEETAKHYYKYETEYVARCDKHAEFLDRTAAYIPTTEEYCVIGIVVND